MRLLRHPSSVRRASHRALTRAVGGLSILLFSALAPLPFSWTVRGAIMGGALLLLWRLLPGAQRAFQGELGESRTLQMLRDLPDDYIAVTNFVAPGQRIGDIDLLLLGPMGVLVVEIKAYHGTIAYLDGAWWRVQTNGQRRPLKSFSAQTRDQMRVIVGLLQSARKREPLLQNIFVPVHGVLSFVGTQRLNVVQLDIPALKAEALKDHLLRLPPRLTARQVEALTALFRPGRFAA